MAVRMMTSPAIARVEARLDGLHDCPAVVCAIPR
jgi:hypothetical protein